VLKIRKDFLAAVAAMAVVAWFARTEIIDFYDSIADRIDYGLASYAANKEDRSRIRAAGVDVEKASLSNDAYGMAYYLTLADDEKACQTKDGNVRLFPWSVSENSINYHLQEIAGSDGVITQVEIGAAYQLLPRCDLEPGTLEAVIE